MDRLDSTLDGSRHSRPIECSAHPATRGAAGVREGKGFEAEVTLQVHYIEAGNVSQRIVLRAAETGAISQPILGDRAGALLDRCLQTLDELLFGRLPEPP